jgi:hypothetical protein
MSQTYITPRPGVASDVIDGETVLLPPHPGAVIVLNELGTAVWQLASQGCLVDEIVERICAEYDVGRPKAEADVLAFVGELARRNLVTLEQRSQL